jgi:hypothetical protein
MSDTAKVDRKEAIVVLDYEGDAKESRDKLRIEARNVERKLTTARRKVTLSETQEAFEAYMKTPESKGVVKIHIIAHGNQEQCGNFNPTRLADWLRFRIKDKPSVRFITIHSCFSGTPHPTNEKIFVEQFASHLLSHMSGGEAGHYSNQIVVRGSDGESYTDSEGHNWVLKEGTHIPKYKTREGEQTFLEKNTQPRASARPKFAIKVGPGFKAVTRV